MDSCRLAIRNEFARFSRIPSASAGRVTSTRDVEAALDFVPFRHSLPTSIELVVPANNLIPLILEGSVPQEVSFPLRRGLKPRPDDHLIASTGAHRLKRLSRGFRRALTSKAGTNGKKRRLSPALFKWIDLKLRSRKAYLAWRRRQRAKPASPRPTTAAVSAGSGMLPPVRPS